MQRRLENEAVGWLTGQRRRALAAAMAALLVGAAACNRGGGDRADGGTTLPTEPSTTPTVVTTATTVPSYEVPEVIDAAYVESVMKALDRVYGESVRLLARTRTVDENFLNYLAAIYSEREFEFQQEIWIRSSAEGFRGLAAQPGDPVTTVQRLARADPKCILAAVTRNLNPTLSSPDEPSPQHYVALAPSRGERDRLRLNPTPWILVFDGRVRDGSEPDDACP